MFVCHRRTRLNPLNLINAPTEAVLRLHHEQPPRSATLYTGITGDLRCRVWQHKNRLIPGFTTRYNLTRLIYDECFFYPDAAIAREKEIKAWRRSKKIQLIESMNPHWNDLAKDWQSMYNPGPGSSEIPRPAGENAGLRDDATTKGLIRQNN
jgi:putative endonuclease